jgi:hypothetical protein
MPNDPQRPQVFNRFIGTFGRDLTRMNESPQRAQDLHEEGMRRVESSSFRWTLRSKVKTRRFRVRLFLRNRRLIAEHRGAGRVAPWRDAFSASSWRQSECEPCCALNPRAAADA